LDHPGPKERPYHHGDLRRAILDAAERLLTEQGVEAVTIRACARAAGVSPAAPIHHFGSLKDLLAELAARGFARLVGRLDADLTAGGHVGKGALTGAYVAFALSSPRLFDLMWREDVLNPAHPDLAAARGLALARLRTHAQGAEVAEDGRLAAIRTWSLAHGLATLLLHGRMVTALGGAGLERAEDFAALAYDPAFAGG
jgi:AcrR family transcriptional regulator